jgi:hypothetical protein
VDRKPVWINGRQIFVFPWAKVWDVLMAAPPSDFLDVWTGRAFVVNDAGSPVCPDDTVLSGQKLFIREKPPKRRREPPAPPQQNSVDAVRDPAERSGADC